MPSPVQEKYGPQFVQVVASMGGEAIVESRGIEYLRELGRKGGQSTRDRYPDHLRQIGAAGGRAGLGGRKPRRK